MENKAAVECRKKADLKSINTLIKKVININLSLSGEKPLV